MQDKAVELCVVGRPSATCSSAASALFVAASATATVSFCNMGHDVGAVVGAAAGQFAAGVVVGAAVGVVVGAAVGSVQVALTTFSG